MMVVYSALLVAVLVVGAPYWLVRMATSGRYRAGLRGRLGLVPKSLQTVVAGRSVIWVHAVSVGEVMAATRLIRELNVRLPGSLVAVSTTTETGQRLAKERLPDSPVFYLPLDLKFPVRRYLRVLRPQMLVLMESELWPRLIAECSKDGTPVVVVNARISDRSFPRYMRLRRLWRPFLEMITLFLAQSAETADRLIKIGAPETRVRVTGNLKYDVQTRADNDMTRRITSTLSGTRLIVAGSTLADEEETLLAAWSAIRQAVPDAALLIAPRHTDRFDEVLQLIRKNGSPFVQCSELMQNAEPIAGGTILFLDTIGDLASVYALASVAFVGGSLVPKGGHNPLEPAQFGVPIVMGPSFENFREIVETMQEANAIRIVAREKLTETLIEMLREKDDSHALGERARVVFQSQSGSTVQTAQAIVALLEEKAGTAR
ncbi:3-deoxy-D-manno-octulosonic acid transferase [Tunturibacter empetritectus]|uniref:3-deoxy-D-manno-octulosonic acid transferase n=1 Tax=Tunturiibacter lichenicola TaxID=2051959 RepID=A0A7W8N3I7_9BACT|nr:3-deoxy-D-manno-octulosonic acid transferase [Edaphobacter lichenicola]MBB5342571.1 3-deoxy-D-manno-octulosonic-acid transferase [Edaphobacter lichenicola]